jgi:hypothetical protein
LAKRSNDLDADIDGLYQLPLQEFTAARNALAARLKKAGHAEDANAIKGLQKPTATAWAVNQLAWTHPKDIDALLDVGERFRAAQAAQLSGRSSDLRGLLNERRDALAGLMKRAAEILEAGGGSVSPDASRRIATTLEALATWGRAEGAPKAGRLIDDLDPPGFEAIAALVPRSAGGGRGDEPTRVLPFRQERRSKRTRGTETDEDLEARRAKANEVVRAAEQALREAQKDAERAEAALKKAAARAKAAEKEKAELEPRYEKAVAAAQEAAKEARQVAQEAEAAAQAVTDAERALQRAKAEIENL